MAGFETVFAETIALERGFVDNPKDSGGATKYGITERVARAHGYTGHMRDLPLPMARAIAKAQYWDLLRLDAIDELAPEVAREMFDTGYNMGAATAGRYLQRALKVLNREQTDYPDVTVDGLIGPMTVAALRAFIAVRRADAVPVLLKALNVQQGEAYIGLAEHRPKDEQFVFGWLKNRVAL